MALFRREAMAARAMRLEGAVSLAVPLSWQIVGGALFAAVAGAALFLVLAQADRIVTLETQVTADGRATAILPAHQMALLPATPCGTLTLAGQGVAMRACGGHRSGAGLRALSNGEVVRGAAMTLRTAAPLPPGARGTVRFAAGRESLWDALVR